MSMTKHDFPVVAGIVQFEPRHREVNGSEVRDIKVRAFGSQEETWITVWPEFAHVPMAAGDFLVVQGKRRQWSGTDRGGNPRLYTGIDAKTLIRLSSERVHALVGADRPEPEPVF